MTGLPLISIITVVRNGRELLGSTIASVRAQTLSSIEFIVIDGGSEDGTQDVIRENSDAITHWISEPDDGIYDAMNKGIQLARGEYLWFLNAGDEIYDSETAEKLVLAAEGSDIYYGETMLVDIHGKQLGLRSELGRNKLPVALSWEDMARGMVVCHQSFLVRRSIAPMYNLSHPYTADIDWVIKCLKAASRVTNTKMILSRFLVGGYSKRHHMKAMLDRYRVYRDHFGFLRNMANHAAIVVEFLYRRIRGKPSI